MTEAHERPSRTLDAAGHAPFVRRHRAHAGAATPDRRALRIERVRDLLLGAVSHETLPKVLPVVSSLMMPL